MTEELMDSTKEESKNEDHVAVVEAVAQENPIIENVKVGEVVNDDNQKVISGPTKAKSSKSSNMQKNPENVLGSRAADRALAKPVVEEVVVTKKEKVALWSNKNIRWTGIGALQKGYNIVTEEASEKWLERQGIRKATPEEVATYFGK